MTPVSYAKRGLLRRSVSIDEVLDPSETNNSFAVFGGTENERVEVLIRGIRRSINRCAIVVLHDSQILEEGLRQAFQPITTIDVGSHSYDPLIGVSRYDAMETRRILSKIMVSKGIVTIRVPPNDLPLQRMLVSEITGLNYLGMPYLLVLCGIRQTPNDSLVEIALANQGGTFRVALVGPSAKKVISHDNFPTLFQNFHEIIFLPIEDLMEAKIISNCLGEYMRSYAVPIVHQNGIWSLRHRNHRDVSLHIQQMLTNNIDPHKLRNHTMVCGTMFKEPILIKRLLL